MITEALRLLRVYYNLTQSELAGDLNVSKSYISEVESGKKKASIDLLQHYAVRFQIPLSALFFFAEELQQGKAADRARGTVAMATLRILDRIAGGKEIEHHVNEEPSY